jgi:hypothetical protein
MPDSGRGSPTDGVITRSYPHIKPITDNSTKTGHSVVESSITLPPETRGRNDKADRPRTAGRCHQVSSTRDLSKAPCRVQIRAASRNAMRLTGPKKIPQRETAGEIVGEDLGRRSE